MNVISAIRNIRAELNVSPKREAELICRGSENKIDIIVRNKKYFESLTKIKSISYGDNISKPDLCSTAVINIQFFFFEIISIHSIFRKFNIPITIISPNKVIYSFNCFI